MLSAFPWKVRLLSIVVPRYLNSVTCTTPFPPTLTGLKNGPRTPCPLSQTHLLSFANIKVKEAILEPGGHLVDVLGVGGTAGILP